MGKGDGAAGGGFWFVGFVGAAVYYVRAADSFGEGLVGFLKAIVWPGFLVYEALKALGA